MGQLLKSILNCIISSITQTTVPSPPHTTTLVFTTPWVCWAESLSRAWEQGNWADSTNGSLKPLTKRKTITGIHTNYLDSLLGLWFLYFRENTEEPNPADSRKAQFASRKAQSAQRNGAPRLGHAGKERGSERERPRRRKRESDRSPFSVPDTLLLERF